MPWVIIGARILSVCIVSISHTDIVNRGMNYVSDEFKSDIMLDLLRVPGSIRSQGRKPRFLLEAGSISSSFAFSRTKLQIHGYGYVKG